MDPILTNDIVISYDMIMTKGKLNKFLSSFNIQTIIKRCPRPNTGEFDTIITVTGTLSQIINLEKELKKFMENSLKIPVASVCLNRTLSETFVDQLSGSKFLTYV